PAVLPPEILRAAKRTPYPALHGMEGRQNGYSNRLWEAGAASCRRLSPWDFPFGKGAPGRMEKQRWKNKKPPGFPRGFLERVKRLEPSTFSLARRCSTN